VSDSGGHGWRPLSERRGLPDANAAFQVSSFTRLARVHALAVAIDALVATALAGSLFFSIPTGEARGRVALYLLLTMAPFAVVAPLIGPALDRARGGRRSLVIGTFAVRAVVCALMIGNINSLLLFPEAFVLLVLSKAYLIAKSALVPTVVAGDEELVQANAKLSLLSAVVGFSAALPGIALLKLGGAGWVLGVGVVLSVAGLVVSLRLAPSQVAPEPPGAAEQAELRSANILLAASAMGLLRGIVGFLTFLLAFDLRGGGNDSPLPVGIHLGAAVRHQLGQPLPELAGGTSHPAWHFGVVLGASVLGSLAGAVVAPRLRTAVSEERILIGSLVGTGVGGLLAALQGGLGGAALLAAVAGLASVAGKLGFDALVQRDAPDANRGRSFARFETRFQIVWVVGAFVPVAFPLPARFGFLLVAGVAAFAVASYLAGVRATHHHHHPPGEPTGSAGGTGSAEAANAAPQLPVPP
jgi:hypothetical protein